MTGADYNKYQERVDQFFGREGLATLLTVDGEDSFFSQYTCDLCGGLPGERYSCYGYNPTTQKVQGGYEICPECIYYCEYGQLPDQTMMEIEEEG